MAKLRKYPRQPKSKANVAVWERYLAKCKDVDKLNAPIKNAAKKKETIKAQVSKLKMK
jgi:hypothetical protein